MEPTTSRRSKIVKVYEMVEGVIFLFLRGCVHANAF